MAAKGVIENFQEMTITELQLKTFEKTLHTFQQKIESMSKEEEMEQNMDTLTGSVKEVHEFVQFETNLTNKEKFKALQQHGRRGKTHLRVCMTIGSLVNVVVTPSGLLYKKKSNAIGQVNAHLLKDDQMPPFEKNIKDLERYIKYFGGEKDYEKRKEIAEAMLKAIYNTTRDQPNFKDVFKDGSDCEREDAIRAAQYFILITQINVAVPKRKDFDGKSGRTPGTDAYYRSLLKQIVKSDGKRTFEQIQSIAFASEPGGAQKARDMAGDANVKVCFQHVQADPNLFKEAVEDMSGSEGEDKSDGE